MALRSRQVGKRRYGKRSSGCCSSPCRRAACCKSCPRSSAANGDTVSRSCSGISAPQMTALHPQRTIHTFAIAAGEHRHSQCARVISGRGRRNVTRPSFTAPSRHPPKRNRTPGLGSRRPGDRGLRGGKPRASVLAGYAVGKRRSRNLSDHEVYSSPSSGPPTSSSSSIFWEDLRTAASISLARSLLAFRNSRTLSRPWPMRWLL
jgi:hypothetical protein